MSIEAWFPAIEFPLSWEVFRQLPQHPAWRYAFALGRARLMPAPRSYHGLLSLKDWQPPATNLRLPGDVVLRPLEPTDRQRLPALMAEALRRMPPFSLLDPEVRRQAAEACLHETFMGSNGPLIAQASLLAFTLLEDGQREPVGAILVTRLPDGDLEDFTDPVWQTEPPSGEDAGQRSWGRPHLTWIFVVPRYARQGIGTALLRESISALRLLGECELASTFLLGNDAAILWHWRNGFVLKSHVLSPRATLGGSTVRGA